MRHTVRRRQAVLVLAAEVFLVVLTSQGFLVDLGVLVDVVELAVLLDQIGQELFELREVVVEVLADRWCVVANARFDYPALVVLHTEHVIDADTLAVVHVLEDVLGVVSLERTFIVKHCTNAVERGVSCNRTHSCGCKRGLTRLLTAEEGVPTTGQQAAGEVHVNRQQTR
ncbi:hypothetical protein D3C71_1324680 [compost metagenome]